MEAFRNKRCKPCFGFHLKGAVKTICYINMLQFVVGTLILLAAVFLADKRPVKPEAKRESQLRRFTWICLYLVPPFVLVLDFLLVVFYRSQNIRGMFAWVIGSLINTTAFLIVYTFKISYFGLEFRKSLVLYGHFVFKYHSFVVVLFYIREKLEEIENSKQCRNLTDNEIKEFEEGAAIKELFFENEMARKNSVSNNILYTSSKKYENLSLDTQVQNKKYPKEIFEIPMDNIIINKEKMLGSGAFGQVFEGQLHSKTDDSVKLVAIKTANLESADVNLFKTFLSELKVMSYVGNHENVISLIGACTEEIKFKKLYIVIEFCAYGSLHDYLRSHRGLFLNQVKNGIIIKECENLDSYSSYEGADGMCTKELLKWSHQTAEGMSYLENKKVVHSDLAARNILLTAEKNVKISDFGLARQLYQYAVYVKKGNTPLPWRWLALESLIDMNFSSKSDVWSYGIAIWEIFSLGETPFPEESFSLEFVNKMKRGVRLSIPTCCTDEIYVVMNLCWSNEIEDRPTFQTLSTFFKSQYEFLAN